MAEFILAILCILAGVIAGGLAILGFFANAMGAATNRDAVDLKPVVICAVLAIAGIGGGIAILVF